MPCYIEDVKPHTEVVNGRILSHEGGRFFWCGSDLGPHCADCQGFGDYLCDYPVGEGKTCDRAMCDTHRNNVAPELDYCDSHYPEWCAYRDSGKPAEHFGNVIPFSSERRQKPRQ